MIRYKTGKDNVFVNVLYMKLSFSLLCHEDYELRKHVGLQIFTSKFMVFEFLKDLYEYDHDFEYIFVVYTKGFF